jgi:bifunctional DNase/RNase
VKKRRSSMVLMQIREFNFCAHHKRGLIVLEDAQQRLTLAFNVHPDEVPRLSQIMKGVKHVIHPLYDFIQSLLDAFLVTPTDVVLDDVPQRGLMAFVYVERAGTRLSVPCYAPDALALAVQMKTPIYATDRALVHAEPRPSSLNTLDAEEDVQAWLAQIKPTDFHTQS